MSFLLFLILCFQIWTSELIRTHQTTVDIIGEKFQLPQLNEINGGDFDGLAYEEIAELNPVEFAKRDQDKLRYRYPNGESYIDVCRYTLQHDCFQQPYLLRYCGCFDVQIFQFTRLFKRTPES